MTLPNDPIILLSYINTQLRDNYPSLDELCQSLDLNEKNIIDKLRAVGYLYDSNINSFI